MLAAIDRRKQISSVILVSAGNFLDMYDFMVFGYYAPWIGRAYFPKSSEFASLMLTFAIFGAGFLMRPVGAVVLGTYVDRYGRRSGLLVTMLLMAIGTLSVACTPGYAKLGVLASILVLAGRLLQGFSAGAQVGSASIYLAEIATPNHKGFYVSWQSASQQVAVVCAATLGLVLSAALTPSQFAAWGWRVPFLIGSVLIPFLFLIRRMLEETPSFLARTERLSLQQVLSSLLYDWRSTVIGVMLVAMTTVAFYLITAYSPTYGNIVLHLPTSRSLTVTLCVGVCNCLVLPISGAVSDKIGRRPLLLACSLITALTCYPAMAWLIAGPSFERLLLVELYLSILYAGYNGAMIVYLTELVPTHIRATGFSFAYSIAAGLFGGFTPAVSTYLIHLTNNKAIPGAWLACAATCGLVATLMAGRRSAEPV